MTRIAHSPVRSRADLAGPLLLLVPLLAIFPLRNNDLWWHLAAGRFMVTSRAFPDLDPFSHTGFLGHWVDNEWLGELLFYGTWRIGGNTGLILLRAVLLTSVFVLLAAYLRKARRPSMAFPAIAIGIALSYSWWGLRPSLFSLIGMLSVMIVLEGARRGRPRLWLLPCLFLAWANLHPGFLFGLLVVVATVAALWIEPWLPTRRVFSSDPRLRMRLSSWTAISAVATLVNPYGTRVYVQQLAIAGNLRYRELLDEWAPPSVPFLVLVLLAIGGFLVLRFREVPLGALAPILGAAVLSTTGVRFEEYFALVAVPPLLVHLGGVRRGKGRAQLLGGLLAGSLLVGLLPLMSSALHEGAASLGELDPVAERLQQRAWSAVAVLAGLTALSLALAWRARSSGFLVLLRRLWRSGSSAVGFALTGVALAGMLLLAWPLPFDGVEPNRYPDACLGAVPDGSRPFHKFSWGGWLIWKRGLRTYVDGRCSGQPIFFEYREARSASGLPILTRRGIDAVILPPSEPVLAPLAAAGWKKVCTDDVSVVMVPADRSSK